MARFSTKFKVGDKVRFTGDPSKCDKPPDPNKVYTVKETPNVFDGAYLKEHNEYFWYSADLLTLVEPDPRQVPGVPEGYRLVRIGPPKKGELHLDWHGKVLPAPFDYDGLNHVVLQRTTKTERLWIVVDLHDGTTSKEWVTDGVKYLAPGSRYNTIETRQTREVPA